MMQVNVRSLYTQGLALALLLCALSVSAQDGRDPTVAPGESAAVGDSPMGVEGMTVLVRDDKPYLVVGTRLYAVGDKVGMMRVDRITEVEVWLHDGRALIKVPRFAGIERTVVQAKPTCASRAGAPNSPVLAPNSPPAATPCEDTQP